MTCSCLVQAVEYVVNLAAAVWQTVPVSGKTGSGDLRSIATSTKDTVGAARFCFSARGASTACVAEAVTPALV